MDISVIKRRKGSKTHSCIASKRGALILVSAFRAAWAVSTILESLGVRFQLSRLIGDRNGFKEGRYHGCISLFLYQSNLEGQKI